MQVDAVNDDVRPPEPFQDESSVGMRAMTPASTESSVRTALGTMALRRIVAETPSRSNIGNTLGPSWIRNR